MLGLAIAVPSLRLRGPYFSLVTFVTVLLFYRLTKALSHWTNGLRGIRVDVFPDCGAVTGRGRCSRMRPR